VPVVVAVAVAVNVNVGALQARGRVKDGTDLVGVNV